MRVSGDSSKLHEMKPRKHRAASHKAGACASRMRCASTPRPASPPSPRPQHPNETPRNGKIRASCMIRGVRAAKRPLRGKIFARCIPERRFAGHFGYMARESCQSQLILDAWRRYVARKGRFSRPRHLLGYMKRKTCHGLPPGNAFREHFAIGKRPGTHRGEILPRQGTRERTAAESCRGKALGNASREYIATASQAKSALGRNPATTGRWRTHFTSILPTERHLRAGGPIALP